MLTWEYGTKDLIIMCLTIISIVFINVYFKKPPTTTELYNQALKQCDSITRTTNEKNNCRYDVTQYYKEIK